LRRVDRELFFRIRVTIAFLGEDFAVLDDDGGGSDVIRLRLFGSEKGVQEGRGRFRGERLPGRFGIGGKGRNSGGQDKRVGKQSRGKDT